MALIGTAGHQKMTSCQQDHVICSARSQQSSQQQLAIGGWMKQTCLRPWSNSTSGNLICSRPVHVCMTSKDLLGISTGTIWTKNTLIWTSVVWLDKVWCIWQGLHDVLPLTTLAVWYLFINREDEHCLNLKANNFILMSSFSIKKQSFNLPLWMKRTKGISNEYPYVGPHN